MTLKLTLDAITGTSTTLIRCYNKYRELCHGIPEVDTSFQDWLNKSPLQTITTNMKFKFKYYYKQDSKTVSCIKIMLKCFSKQLVNRELVRSWPPLILQAQSWTSYTFLEDSLTVAVQFLTADEVIKLFMDYVALRNCTTGQFNPLLMNMFFECLHQESLLDSLECGAVLSDVVKWCQGKGCDECYDAVLRLVDKVKVIIFKVGHFYIAYNFFIIVQV